MQLPPPLRWEMHQHLIVYLRDYFRRIDAETSRSRQVDMDLLWVREELARMADQLA